MVSEANQKQIEAAGLSFILGMRIPHVPYVVSRWRREHPGEDIPDRQVFTQPWPTGPNGWPPRPGHLLPVQGRPGQKDPARHRRAGRQGRAGRRRERAGQAEQVHPAIRHPVGESRAGAQGQGPGRPEGLRHQPAVLPRRHPGHGRVRDRRLPPAIPGREVIPDGQSDLQARPIYHRIRDSIEAHLIIVFTAWQSAAGSRTAPVGPSANS